ncbi:Type 1 glutamine amidotransferase-like domain-containing protein [Patescibacteria group bacterium]
MNKKLVLHSEHIQGHTQLDLALFQLLMKNDPRISYISSQTDPNREYFKQTAKWYKEFGVNDFTYFDFDQEYDENKLDDLLSADAIFLSGGNTFYFLDSLKQKNFLSKLRDFVFNGGILIGLSAGSIIMSEDISMASGPEGDENTVGLDDLSSLGLIDFYFYPHFDQTNQSTIKYLKEFSKKNKTIYACTDGSGILIEDEKLKFIGKIFKFEKGIFE